MDLQHGVMERECVTEVEMRNIDDHPPSLTSLLYRFSVPWTDELSCRSE